MSALLALGGFFACLALLVGLRAVNREKFGVTTADAAIAAVPVVIGLLVCGSIGNVKFGADGIEVSRAIETAGSKPAWQLRTDLRIEHVSVGGRQTLQTAAQANDRVDDLIKRGTPIIVFAMHEGHSPDAVQVYLKRLMPEPFFRYVIINDQNGRFFGWMPAPAVMSDLAQRAPGEDKEAELARQISDWLNTSNENGFRTLPGFVERVLDDSTPRLAALKLMDQDAATALPFVVDGEFRGIVDRSQLLTSMVLDICSQVTLSVQDR
jgi:hypothetical protein